MAVGAWNIPKNGALAQVGFPPRKGMQFAKFPSFGGRCFRIGRCLNGHQTNERAADK